MSNLVTGEPKRIAVVGGGVAGITAAWYLQRQHRVTLFEKNNYVGGHTNTICIERGPDAGTQVDTGFIVCNDRTYPNFHRLMKDLGVGIRWSDMSFGFHDETSGLQYAGTDLWGMFAQRKNLASPGYWMFLLEIARFCKVALRDLESGRDLSALTLGTWLGRHQFSERVIRDYVLPMGAAIWSTGAGKMMKFPAATFIRFFKNHGLLKLADRPRWQTVIGGSQTYVRAFLSQWKGKVFTDAAVKGIVRHDGGARVRLADGTEQHFDAVIVAVHADQVLTILEDPTPSEQKLFSAWSYERNRVVLHRDPSVMPPLRGAWASWNYTRERLDAGEEALSMTYYMNRLQGLRTRHQYFVTLNRRGSIRDESILRTIDYTHPLFTRRAIGTQSLLPSLNGTRSTWFCGSYCGYGFHEDAVASGVRVANSFGIAHCSDSRK